MNTRKLALAPIAAAVMAFGTPAIADNSVTFQGVTFGIHVVDADSIDFSILNATSATGDWTGITNLDAFQFKTFGTVSSSSTAAISPDQFNSNVTSSLSAGGCGTQGTEGVCFTADPAHLALSSNMTWRIDFTNVANMNWAAPHLSIEFTKYFDPDGNGKKPLGYYKTGSLFSDTIPTTTITRSIPEPETYAMLLAGLGLMGFVARRRQQRGVSA